jgi:hypothetical protein
MKFGTLVYFWILITKKILKKFFRVFRSKNSHDLDPCFSGKLHKQDHVLYIFRKNKDYKFI